MKRIAILDAQGSCLRCVNAAGGEPAAGFRLWLKKYFDNFSVPPKDLIAVWDGGNDLRRGWYPNYKGNRAPDNERDQAVVAAEDQMFTLVKSFLAAVGAVQISCPMTEADDVIALLCRQLPGLKEVYTSDKDLAALAAIDDVQVILADQPVGASVTIDKVEVPVQFVTLYKSFVGDSSDNYNGVPGIGPVTWGWIVEQYGMDGLAELDRIAREADRDEVDSLVADLPNDKFFAKLQAEWPRWMLMYRLASFHPDMCYRTGKGQVIKPQFYVRVPNRERLQWVLNKAGCLGRFDDYVHLMPVELLVTQDNLETFLEDFRTQLSHTEIVSFDYEGYDILEHPAFQEAKAGNSDYYVDTLSQRVTGASFNYGRNQEFTAYVSVDHTDTANVAKEVIADLLCEIPPEKLHVHNAAFESIVSEVDEGIAVELQSPKDTMIMAAYVDEDDRKGLKYLSKLHLGYQQDSYQETLERAGARNMKELTGQQVLHYGCDDSLVTSWLTVLFRLSMQMEGTWDGVNQYEFTAIHPLNHGFMTGVNVDIDRLKELEQEDAKVIEEGMARIRQLLQEHCSEVRTDGAVAYFDDQMPFWRDSLRLAGKSEEEIEEKLQAKKQQLIDSSVYVPYREVKKPVEFIPTKVQFQKVCDILGIRFEIPADVQQQLEDGEISELPEDCFDLTFPNPSGKAITAWLAEAYAWLSAADPERRGAIEDFLSLVPPAVPQLKTRKGKEYATLVGFCESILAEQAGTEWVGDELNFDSPVQSHALLYCKLGLPVRVRAKFDMKSKRYKLGYQPGPAGDDKAVETAIAEDGQGDNAWKAEVLQTVRDVKAARTRGKLYYKPYPLWVHPRDGMLHPQIINCGTATHRPTGSSPNFLQLTKKDGGKIRSVVRGRYDDHIIISPDFAGQELRILASECRDPVLMEAFLPAEGGEEKDIHALTGSTIVQHTLRRENPELLKLVKLGPEGVDYHDFEEIRNADLKSEQWLDEHGADNTELYKRLQEIFKQARKDAKPVNFLINYLGSAGTLSRNMGVPREVAQTFIDMTFKRYARIAPWQQEMIRFAALHGYTQTAYGTRRHVTDAILSRDGGIRSRMERQAVNFIIQGCAARILKIVLTEVWKTRLLQETGASIIAPVYDELTASVPMSAVVEYSQRLSEIMTVTPPGHPIPMKPELSLGPNWGILVEMGAYPSADVIEEAIDKIRVARKAA